MSHGRGTGLYRALLRLIPGWLRKRAGDEMLALYEERLREARAAGGLEGVFRVHASEIGGLVRTAIASHVGRTPLRKEPGRIRFSLLDFKLGWRMLVRYPGLTVVGSLAMAFAIALGAAAFEAITQIVSPTLPFPGGERIVAIHHQDLTTSRAEPTTAGDFRVLREEMRSLEDLGAYRSARRNLLTEGTAGPPIVVAEVSASMFPVTGVVPLLGRGFDAADERDDAPPVLVIGYDVWRSRFAADPGAIGAEVRLGADPATVVGVMPEGFVFPMAHDAWTPLREERLRAAADAGEPVDVFGRLAGGATIEEARAELAALGTWAPMGPEGPRNVRPEVGPYAEIQLPIVCGISWSECLALMRAGMLSSNLAFVAFLALVCANVALLMFARAATREAEIVVRSALGASRGRIVLQLVAEALVLGGMAAVIGLAGAAFALRMAKGMLDQVGQIPFWWTPTLSGTSVLYTVVLTVIGAAIAGVLPALKVTRGRRVRLREVADRAGALHFGGVWTAVIVTQIALTVVAVAATSYVALLSRTMVSADPGFPVDEYLSARLDMGVPVPLALREELERRLRAEPGVAGVAFTDRLPGGSHGTLPLELEGAGAPVRVQTAAVAPGFFEAFDVALLEGRMSIPGDADSGVPTVVVNEAFAERFAAGRSALGMRVRLRTSGEQDDAPWGAWQEVVGVVEQMAMSSDPESTQAGVYLPIEAGGPSAVHLAVRARGATDALAPRLREIAAEVDPELGLSALRPLREVRADEARFYTLWARILLGASALVLALSLAGIYSIMSFAVSRRTREIGIRLALGADRRRLVWAVFRRPIAQVAGGVGLGTGALLAMVGLEELRSPTVALTLLGIGAMVLCVCGLACIVPTRRALEVEPTDALRSEG